MAARYVDEVGIVARRPDGESVAEDRQHETYDPQSQPQSERRCEGAVDDGQGSGSTRHQDRLGEGAVDGSGVAGWQVSAEILIEGHLDQGPAAKRKEG